MADKNIQWHPGFYAGIELELKAYHLSFEQEHQLTRGPLSIDLLIIKKLMDEKIDNDIAEIFRRHNVVEFKSPEDELSIDVFFKTQAYAGLYKASGETVNEIPADEVTVSLFRDVYPREMADQLKALGYTITQRHPGIYQIDGKLPFPTQLVVTSQLRPGQHTVLRILSNHAEQKDIEDFIKASMHYKDSGDRARADSILQVSASANKALYREIYQRGDASMCEALMEIMKDDIDKKVEQGRAEGEAKGRTEGEAQGRIAESVVIYRDEMNLDDSTIISRIRDKFGLSQEIAEGYVLAER